MLLEVESFSWWEDNPERYKDINDDVITSHPSEVASIDISNGKKVIINRPNKLNCLNYQIVQLLKMFEVYENDPTIKFLMLTSFLEFHYTFQHLNFSCFCEHLCLFRLRYCICLHRKVRMCDHANSNMKLSVFTLPNNL
uniref:Uncharacterized protein n=1 Tax=Lactuca sativa TaxID=4236 RepID=A0A9R1X4H7_LACSA|nr:hypothetical protein LSAT_V11C700364100 [Lactuca sativa]